MSLTLPTLILLSSFAIALSHPQSNYADQANNIEYQGDGLPEQATLDGKVTKLDDLSPVIFLNRTRAVLNCAAGSMQIELKFNEPFKGIIYANDRNSPCHVYGKGTLNAKIELPLKGCGTKQDPLRVFTNDIHVRFHPALEFDGDEIITVVCRYPPPIAPPPAVLPDYIKTVTPAPVVAPPLRGFQILLIICGILFLSLMLLGLGCSYYCLKRRQVIIKQPFSSIGSDSEITKLSGSSLGNLSMFEGLKIPRAHAPVQAEVSSSGSDGPPISDTLPSDYPSESHSEIEELDTRSLPVSSAGSFENKAFVQDNSSVYSEGYGHTQEQQIQNAVATPVLVPRLPLAIKEQPKFDVLVKVSRSPPAPPSLSISDTESSVSRNLTTIQEEIPPRIEKSQFTYMPELHHPPKHIQPAPTYNRILKRQQELSWEEPRPRSLASLDTEMTDTHSVTEMIDESHRKLQAPIPPPPPPIIPRETYVMEVAHKPEITSHFVDDVFLRTITEKKTIEDIEHYKRSVTEYQPKPIDNRRWDVTIKNYPVEMAEPPDWENFSDISSASGLTISSIPEKHLPPQNTIDDNKLPLNSPELVGNIGHVPRLPLSQYLSEFNVPIDNPQIPNWNVLIRVFHPNEQEGPVIENAETFNSQLTAADKVKWRQIITTESTLRTLLTEAVVREDFERISHDTRYRRLFEPPKWEVIIRILAPPPEKQKNRYKKKADWDTRSRRSSLPTLYEYDSDGGSSVRTLTREPIDFPAMRSRRTSRSSYRSEADLRSMSEMTVDFGRPDHGDSQSELSNYYIRSRYDDDSEPEIDYRPAPSRHPSMVRSLSQPSLARSASEFTEHWAVPSRYDTASEFTSPEGTPKSQRSTKIYPLHVPRGTAEHSAMWQSQASSQVTRTPGGMTGAQVVTREVTSHSSARFMSSQGQGWFGDNDSDSNFK